VYHGYPELGVAFLPLRNGALARDLGVTTPGAGIAVTYVDPFGGAAPLVKAGDVMMAIDGFTIADDGSIALNGHRVLFAELIERKQWGDAVSLDLLRGGKPIAITVPLTHPPDPFAFRRQYDANPRYLVRGGMVFSPLSRELLQEVLRSRSGKAEDLAYFFEYAKIDGLYREFDEFVVYLRRLPHAINAYTDGFLGGIVTHANDEPVSRLADLKRGWDGCEEEFHVLRFAGMDDVLVIPAGTAAASHQPLMGAYGIPAAENLEGTE
jgi:hypothetical protein